MLVLLIAVILKIGISCISRIAAFLLILAVVRFFFRNYSDFRLIVLRLVMIVSIVVSAVAANILRRYLRHVILPSNIVVIVCWRRIQIILAEDSFHLWLC